MHIPVYVMKIVSFQYLDQLVNKTTLHLENLNPALNITYYSIWKASVILEDEFEQRLIQSYGVDIGQVSKAAFEE